jgi:hypothetical protein
MQVTANETQFTMYSDKLTLASTTVEDETLLTEFTCNVDVELAGDSLWGCELERVTIVSIHTAETFSEDDDYISTHIRVMYTVNGEEEYENSWTIYTDSGFEEAVSDLFLTDIRFTEQGMQEDGYASMEF